MENKEYEIEKGFDDINRNFFDEDILNQLLSRLNYLKNEYVVEGAQLTCTRCTKERRTLKYKGEAINCDFDNKKSRDRICVLEERSEEINGYVPVNVKDCKGGLQYIKRL